MPQQDGNILKGLQDYQKNPPADIFDKIISAVTGADDAPARQVLGQLQQYAVQPPAAILATTEAALFGEKKLAPVKRIPARYWYQAAAAILVVALGVWWFTRSDSPANNNSSMANENNSTKQTPVVINPVNPDTTIKSINKQEQQLVAIVKDNNSKQRKTARGNMNAATAATTPLLAATAASIGGLTVPVADDDVFATLINYTYNSQEAFWKEEDKEVFIALNQYSSMTISEKMLALMKKMYRVKGNNKIPRSAKRAQARLAKWKAADAMQFDSSSNKNPLDIIDLSDFFFKK